ncbi:MAG: winged helix-turn-helix transcriptional regulator, partial [Candidatus Buchananbacteria bacterium]|nr:winged helix-turn-helix transcriptional regulator [Candidatus Buchananbacteria bacterium]
MLEKIINSKVRLAILSLFFTDSNKEFYLQEVVSKTKLDQANIHKELSSLVKAGILVVKKTGAKKYYQLNSKNPFFAGLKTLFEKYNQQTVKDVWFMLEEIPPKINP